jgi:hypothetical protein
MPAILRSGHGKSMPRMIGVKGGDIGERTTVAA